MNMNNSELLQAIAVCNKCVHGCNEKTPRYEPLINHLKALLAEQLMRATQNIRINISENSSKIEQETRPRRNVAGY